MLREWSRSRSQTRLKWCRGGRRLSADPFSYKYFVANIMTTTPDQSAIALPKNDPRWVLGLETLRPKAPARGLREIRSPV